MISLVTDIKLSIRNLSRNINRSLVAGLTVAGGIVAFLLAGGFINWIFHDMREATIHSQLGHIQVVRPGYFDNGISDPYSFLLPAASPELKLLEEIPEVATVTPRLAFSGLASRDEVTIPFIGEGIDPIRERPISTRITIVEGRDLATLKDAEVILGEGLARSLEAKLGDKIVLLATAANGSANAIELLVVGTFATIYKDYDDTVIDLVSPKLPASAFQIIPWTQLADFYNKTVALFSKQVDVMKLIIGLIIVLTISNTQTMSVLERTTEIGTSLAIGLRNNDVLRLFLVEGLLIGIIGGFIGVTLGYGLAEAISYIGIPMPPPPGMARGFTGQILVNGALALDAMILALVTTLLASVMPAWRASRMNIVDALRCNQ